LGPLSKGDFQSIVVSNCILRDCGGGGIKIGMFEGARIRNCIFSSIVMERVTAPVLIMNAQWTPIGSQDSADELMPPGEITDIRFSNLTVEAHAGPTPPWDNGTHDEAEIRDFLSRPDRNSTIFLHGHRDGVIRRISLQNIRLIVPGGGAAETDALDRLPDMHQIDIHKRGYWTDDKSVWGVPISSAVYARHVEHLTISGIDVSHQQEERRPAFAFVDCRAARLGNTLVDDRPMREADVFLSNCRGLGQPG
jgi:hypothetical protein